jgi:hypothetical protein
VPNRLTDRELFPVYALPAGESLVVTDIVTTVFGCQAGSVITNNLYSASSTASARVYNRYFIVDSTGGGTMADHFTTGFVFTGPNLPDPVVGSTSTCTSLVMTLEGVEIPGTPTVGSFQ